MALEKLEQALTSYNRLDNEERNKLIQQLRTETLNSMLESSDELIESISEVLTSYNRLGDKEKKELMQQLQLETLNSMLEIVEHPPEISHDDRIDLISGLSMPGIMFLLNYRENQLEEVGVSGGDVIPSQKLSIDNLRKLIKVHAPYAQQLAQLKDECAPLLNPKPNDQSPELIQERKNDIKKQISDIIKGVLFDLEIGDLYDADRLNGILQLASPLGLNSLITAINNILYANNEDEARLLATNNIQLSAIAIELTEIKLMLRRQLDQGSDLYFIKNKLSEIIERMLPCYDKVEQESDAINLLSIKISYLSAQSISILIDEVENNIFNSLDNNSFKNTTAGSLLTHFTHMIGKLPIEDSYMDDDSDTENQNPEMIGDQYNILGYNLEDLLAAAITAGLSANDVIEALQNDTVSILLAAMGVEPGCGDGIHNGYFPSKDDTKFPEFDVCSSQENIDALVAGIAAGTISIPEALGPAAPAGAGTIPEVVEIDKNNILNALNELKGKISYIGLPLAKIKAEFIKIMKKVVAENSTFLTKFNDENKDNKIELCPMNLIVEDIINNIDNILEMNMKGRDKQLCRILNSNLYYDSDVESESDPVEGENGIIYNGYFDTPDAPGNGAEAFAETNNNSRIEDITMAKTLLTSGEVILQSIAPEIDVENLCKGIDAGNVQTILQGWDKCDFLGIITVLRAKMGGTQTTAAAALPGHGPQDPGYNR
jgi:hypothetical protein